VEVVEEVMDALGLNEEKMRELLDEVFKVASKMVKEEGGIVTDRLREFVTLAKTKEEGFLVGMIVTMIAYDLRIATDPFSILTSAGETIAILKAYAAGNEGNVQEALDEASDAEDESHW